MVSIILWFNWFKWFALEKCEVARYRAIIKKHTDQHEYELGKYTMELLRQVKFT